MKRDPKGLWKESGNPKGRPKKDPAVSAFREMATNDLANIFGQFGQGTRAQALKVLDDPNTTMNQRIFLRIMVKAEAGDKDALNVWLDRSLGKVKEQIEIEKVNPVREELKKLSVDELLAIMKSDEKDDE